MNPALENYEHLSSLTSQMRLAATQGEWDRLIELEKQCSQRVAFMKVQDANTPLDEGARLQKVALIRKILADDAEIRNQMEPWMTQIQLIMQSAQQESRLLETYSSGT